MTGVRRWFIVAGLALGTVSLSSLGATQQRVAISGAESVSSGERQVFSRPVTVHLEAVSLEKAVSLIAANARVRIHYQIEDVDAVTRRITFHSDGLALGNVLDSVLAGTGLRAVSSVPNVITLRAEGVPSQIAQGVVTGKVLHANTGVPVVGAKVTVGTTAQGIVTDDKGTFRLTLPAGEHAITVRALGMVRQVRTVTVSESVVELLFSLEPSANVLGEVVVTGTVVETERKAITTPITVITADDLEKRGITRIEQLFRGEIPGVVAQDVGTMTYQSTLGASVSSNIYSRGSASLSGVANPIKTFIDGVEVLDPSYLGTVDPQSIARIEIITGPQAATVYGSGAMGGIMQIFTKKGSGDSTPDFTLKLQYGLMQNSLTSNYTPTHNDALTVLGGTGPEFTYSGTLSYRYSGQWQPELFSQTFSGSAGATHIRGPFTVNASLSASGSRNGTIGIGGQITGIDRYLNGEWRYDRASMTPSARRSASSSQTQGLNLDYQATPFGQHHVTVGRNQTDLSLDPSAPQYASSSDSLFSSQSSTGHRTTLGYNMTLVSAVSPIIRGTMTLGANGSRGKQVQYSGNIPTKTSTSYVSPSVYVALNSRNWGGFGSWQIGLFDRVFLTYGLRAETNPSYGENHKIDWTPTNGITYSLDLGDLTVKLLGSYGRATKPPSSDWRLQEIRTTTDYSINEYIVRIANPDLTPEYSRGPQGGVELYYGNRGSLTLNFFSQKVTDLIQKIRVDSIPAVALSNNDSVFLYQEQYVNAGTIRQKGIETTGSIILGQLTLKGTYSWNDSRILFIRPRYEGGFYDWQQGASPMNVPTHFGNVVANYAHGPTTVTLAINFMGKMNDYSNETPQYFDLAMGIALGRSRTYLPKGKSFGSYAARPGYAKSDLAMSQRLSPWASFTLTVNNLANSYSSDLYSGRFPTLGRQTLLGMTLRYPNR